MSISSNWKQLDIENDFEGEESGFETGELEEILKEIWAENRSRAKKEARKDARVRFRKRIANCLSVLDRGEEARRVASCGTFFHVRNSVCNTDVLTLITCHHRLCPDCTLLRVRPMQERLDRILKKVKKFSAFRFVTLTIPSTRRIDRASVDGIIAAFRKLRRQDFWAEIILGGFYAIDMTWTKENGWHLHLHVLIHVKCSVPGVVKEDGWMLAWWLRRLKQEWYDLVVTDKKKIKKINIHIREVDEGVRFELVKYVAKAASFSHTPALVGEYLDAFENVRQLESWGSFRGDKKKYSPEPVVAKRFCKCGNCGVGDWRYAGVVHVSETRLLPDGTRVLGLTVTGLPPPRGDVSLN